MATRPNIAQEYLANVGHVGNDGPIGSGYLDNIRRTYDMNGYLSRLLVTESPFLAYAQMMQRKPTSDVNFKWAEQRDLWQRRDFKVHTAVSASGIRNAATRTVRVYSDFDGTGRLNDQRNVPVFLVVGQTISLQGRVASAHSTDLIPNGAGPEQIFMGRIQNISVGSDYAELTLLPIAVGDYSQGEHNAVSTSTATMAFDQNAQGRITGSAWAEGSGAPKGYRTELFDRQGFCQIFKTSIPLFSKSLMHMDYRYYADEFSKTWMEAVRSHKHDLARAFLFNSYGGYEERTVAGSDYKNANPKRYSFGFIPFVRRFGVKEDFTYASTQYDNFVDFLEYFVEPTKGIMSDNLLMHVSRKTMTWFSKLGGDTFLNNTLAAASSKTSYDIVQPGGLQMMNGRFGHSIAMLNTRWGNIKMVVEELLRGEWEDVSFIQSVQNVKYRPLANSRGSRDYIVETNIQDNDVDARQDLIITEAGLQIELPETHAVIQWS